MPDTMLSDVAVQAVCLVMSDCLQPHGLQPTRLFCPWDFPGKSTGVGGHCLLHTVVIAKYGNAAAMEECFHYVKVFLKINLKLK